MCFLYHTFSVYHDQSTVEHAKNTVVGYSLKEKH